MRRRRKIEGFNLAFLDIMSCGLGAVILVLMLVKQDVDAAHREADLLGEDLARLEAQAATLGGELEAVDADAATEADRIGAASRALALSREQLADISRDVAEKQAELQGLKRSIEATEPVKQPDVIDTPQANEEAYLIGLRVEGQRIGILVDSSASMTDELLIDIIRRKNASPAERQAGPKWARTQRIVDWLLARAPATSELAIVAYAETATEPGGAGWIAARDGAALERVRQGFARSVPGGGTNLKAGLDAMAALRPSDIYIITDGLPTTGGSGYKSLNPFSGCSALWGGSSTISGDCRARLFLHTINKASLAGITINVILLPIEGDPDAAALYWRWTAATGGLLITPATSWP